MADPDHLAFCWVVDFPMFEPDEQGGWDFSHNPFSMPQGGLEALDNKDPGDILAFQYDVVCNGLELSSGAVRNHLPEVMEKAFAVYRTHADTYASIASGWILRPGSSRPASGRRRSVCSRGRRTRSGSG